MPPGSRRNLLVCFDAFGTLFAPRAPVHRQYDEIAKSVGLRGFDADDVRRTFKAAFKQESKQNPNYGKANGLNAEKWWSNIIVNTFRPLIQPEVELPKELVPKLLNRFRSDEGYVLQPGAKHLLDKFRNQRKASSSHVMTGIITNSDDRVPGILSSLGLRVSPLRFGDEPSTSTWSEEAYDIDFSVMSYDVGAEKPDRRIFRAAEDMALIATADAPESDGEDAVWGCLYIGDDYASDVGGALNAGWKVVLLGREGETGDGENLERLPSGEAGDLFDILGYTDAVTCESLTQLACWLPESS